MNSKLKKAIIRLGIVFSCMLVLLASFLVIKNYIDEKNNGTIYFYIDEELLGENRVKQINDVYLNSLMDKVDKKAGYDYIWSFSSDKIEEVDFNSIKTNDIIYLLEVAHKYNVSFVNDNIEYEVLSNEDITYNSLFRFKVKPIEGKKNIVIANGRILEENNEGIYECKITADLVIDVVDKDIVVIEVMNNKFVYDGNKKEIEYKLLANNVDVSLIRKDIQIKYYLDNARNYEVEPVDAGIYYVSIFYELDEYVIEKVDTSILIEKADPVVTSWPIAYNNYEGTLLSDVIFISGTANVSGKFVWTNPLDKLTSSINEYNISFVPDDSNYNVVNKNISVNIFTYVEMLDVVKEEKEELIEEYKEVDLVHIRQLPTVGKDENTMICWFSADTLVSVSNTGEVRIITNVANYEVKLYALIYYDDVVEYCEFSYIINNDLEEVKVEIIEENKVIKYAKHKEDAIVYNAPILDINSVLISNEKDEVEVISVSRFKVIRLNYKMTSRFIGMVSEVIIWKVISNKDKGDDAIVNTSTLFKDFKNTNMKGVN